MALTEEGLIHVPGMLSRWVRLANGARAHYMTAGESGPAVVLLHGGIAGSSGTAGWRFMAPYLAARGFRVYCPDMPGFGLADTHEEYWPRDPRDHVAFIEQFVTALCLDEFHLAGNSMGCMNAAFYVVQHPERVTSVIFIAGSVGNVVPAHVEKPAPMITQRYEGTPESMRAMMEAIMFRPDVVSDDLLEMRYLAAERQSAAFAGFAPNMRRYGQFDPNNDPNVVAALSTNGRLDQLTIPMIYLYGKNDVLIPVEWGYAQEDALPNVQFFYPDECGHQGQTDQPEMFGAVFSEFFATGRVTAGTAAWAGISTRRSPLAHLVETD